MSFQSKTDKELEESLTRDIEAKVISSFERHIIQCCKAPEWELRKWLRKTLSRAGFTIYEDGYLSDRVKKDKRYDTVHNMLAIRGEKPAVCLVSHTDVCRDHSALRGSVGKYSWMMGAEGMESEEEDKNDKDKVVNPPVIDPIVKVFKDSDGSVRRIIQDRLKKFQTGGDDRLGVAIITWIALNTGYDMGLYFPTDEEIGLQSARVVDFDQLGDFELFAEVDKGNSSHNLVIKISNEILCDYDMATRLLEIAYNCGSNREPITGYSTDVFAMKSRGKIKNAVNMSCGYHNSISDNADEYIDMPEAEDTLKFVASIVKDFYLKG